MGQEDSVVLLTFNPRNSDQQMNIKSYSCHNICLQSKLKEMLFQNRERKHFSRTLLQFHLFFGSITFSLPWSTTTEGKGSDGSSGTCSKLVGFDCSIATFRVFLLLNIPVI